MAVRSIFLAAPNAAEFNAVIDGVVLPVLGDAGLQVVRMPNLGSPMGYDGGTAGPGNLTTMGGYGLTYDDAVLV